MKRKLLWIGDAGCDSGFARATHKTLEVLRRTWDVVVLGINYRGYPHEYPYKIYPAYVPGGSLMGDKTLLEIYAKERPDLIVIQNDPWNVPRYMEKIRALKQQPVVVGAIAVDGKNLRASYIQDLDYAIFWTGFAEYEARAGGFFKPAGVVGLGVDLEIYKPGDRLAARKTIGLPAPCHSGFIVMNTNRNQPRKRIDLTFEYFAEFVHKNKLDNAYLYLHVCPTGDVGVDCEQLTRYYGLRGKVLLEQPGVYEGYTEEELVLTYQAADVQISTTQGEGWGLTTLEGMACGIPQVVPDWSALGDWARPAARLVPCTSHGVTFGGVNVIGGVPDKKDFIASLETMYYDGAWRERHAAAGLALAHQPQFRWENIGLRFTEEVDKAWRLRRVESSSQPEGRPGDAGKAEATGSALPG
jgi:glycosyltransferase involved in cell wall biosynthesis